MAQETPLSAASLISENPGVKAGQSTLPFPLLADTRSAGLPFNVGGSETRKISLQLAEPLTLNSYATSRWLNLGSGSILTGTSLNWAAGNQLMLGVGMEQQQNRVQFKPLGSIHCQNGILEAGSYRASDCYFTNESNDLKMGSISIGAEYDFHNEASAAINLFRQESSLDTQSARRPGRLGGAAVLDAGLLTPVLTNPLLPGHLSGDALSYLDADAQGIDLEFRLGVSTDNAGDMQLGLQFTRVLEANYNGLLRSGGNDTDWTLADPFDSATVSFDWQRNAFAGGIQGFYREPVEFLNQSTLDGVTTFDVYFTWRTPWNASLSVGASNLLNKGKDKTTANKNTVQDPFEAVYGRIPYVRYQQDL